MSVNEVLLKMQYEAKKVVLEKTYRMLAIEDVDICYSFLYFVLWSLSTTDEVSFKFYKDLFKKSKKIKPTLLTETERGFVGSILDLSYKEMVEKG